MGPLWSLIQLDAAPVQGELVNTTMALIQARYLYHILHSHGTGWYNPANSDGLPNEGYRGYTALTNEFLPALSA